MVNEDAFSTALRRISDQDARHGALAFEDLVVRLLEAHVASQGKYIAYESGGAGPRIPLRSFDAVLPAGIDTIEGPTGVEIKYSRQLGKSFATRLSEFAGQLSLGAARLGLRSGLLIHNGTLAQSQLEYADAFLRQLPEEPRIVIWGVEDLRPLADLHPNALTSTDYASPEKVLFDAIERELRRPQLDWRSEAELAIQEIRTLYRDQQFTLFLGAGVSVEAGIPSWDDLLAELYLRLVSDEFSQLVEDQTQLEHLAMLTRQLGGGAPLLTARYLRSGLERISQDARPFQEYVSDILYRRANEAEGRLLQAVAKICTPERTGAAIRAVITFNFDDLLERILDSRGLKHHPIYLAHDPAGRESLPIYHVHGFLPRQRDGYARVEESLLTLSEEGYHTVYGDPYHWSNIVQLNALRETPCLFVGLSMTDPNLRRLLDVAATGEKTRHYVFSRRTSEQDLEQLAKQGGTPDAVDSRTSSSLLRKHHLLLEQLMKELDVRVVWYEEHCDVPEMLERLRD